MEGVMPAGADARPLPSPFEFEREPFTAQSGLMLVSAWKD